jgi:hypothetical protein
LESLEARFRLNDSNFQCGSLLARRDSFSPVTRQPIEHRKRLLFCDESRRLHRPQVKQFQREWLLDFQRLEISTRRYVRTRVGQITADGAICRDDDASADEALAATRSPVCAR